MSHGRIEEKPNSKERDDCEQAALLYQELYKCRRDSYKLLNLFKPKNDCHSASKTYIAQLTQCVSSVIKK